MFVLKVVGDAGLVFRCPPLRPLQPGGGCSPVGWCASPPLGAGKLPLFLQPSPGAPAPLPSPPLLSSLSHSPLPPSRLTPSDHLTSHQALPFSVPQFPHPRHGMKRNNRLAWLGEAEVRLEAEIMKAPMNRGAGTAQVSAPCSSSLPKCPHPLSLEACPAVPIWTPVCNIYTLQ